MVGWFGPVRAGDHSDRRLGLGLVAVGAVGDERGCYPGGGEGRGVWAGEG